MTETTQAERDCVRYCAEKQDEDGWDPNLLLLICNDADRLAAIERQVIYRTEDMPEWAVAWNKAASGRYCWFVGLHIAQEADNPTPQPAPDLRPDEPGPLWLPIIDAPDAGGE